MHAVHSRFLFKQQAKLKYKVCMQVASYATSTYYYLSITYKYRTHFIHVLAQNRTSHTASRNTFLFAYNASYTSTSHNSWQLEIYEVASSCFLLWTWQLFKILCVVNMKFRCSVLLSFPL